jgi:Carboxypeptidase regulatory-like domain
MRRMRRVVMILTVAAFGGGSAHSVALAQDSASARTGGTIAGVVDGRNGQPLAGVAVEALGVASLRTDSTGQFRVTGLAAGSYIVRARKVGYLAAMKVVTLAGDAPLQVPITLESAGQPLPAVVSNVDSAALMLQDPTGFSWRERMGQGV